MIFLRQTSYTNSNPNSSSNLNRHERNRSHLRSANANRNRPNRPNNQNYLLNASRPSPATIQPNLGNLTTTNQNSTNRELIRSVKINERLASIGGLFGVLSIIITGALLYALFTGKSEDRWYYIIAVLINVSLLIILMFAAIVFDRIYLRKFDPNQSCANSIANSAANSASSSSGANRVINVNPLFYPSVYVTPANLTSINDVPPRYPGYSVPDIYSNSNTTNQHVNGNNSNSTVINLNNSLEKDLANPQRTDGTVCVLSVLNEQTTNRNLTSAQISPSSAISSSSNSPPNYFDLYPVKNII
jgi:hypothetical protein